jgi:hypothetical protein
VADVGRPAIGESGLLQGGGSHPSAKVFPLNNSGRQLAMYDPRTKKLTHISTCFSTHHLMFAETRTTRCGRAAAAAAEPSAG